MTTSVNNLRKVTSFSAITVKSFEKIVKQTPLHDSELIISRNLLELLNKVDNFENLRSLILEELANFKIIPIPRCFFKFISKIDLVVKEIKEEGANQLIMNRAIVVDLKIELKNITPAKDSSLTLIVESMTVFHHNYGNPEDITTKASEIKEKYEVSGNQMNQIVTLMINFPVIGVIYVFRITNPIDIHD